MRHSCTEPTTGRDTLAETPTPESAVLPSGLIVPLTTALDEPSEAVPEAGTTVEVTIGRLVPVSVTVVPDPRVATPEPPTAVIADVGIRVVVTTSGESHATSALSKLRQTWTDPAIGTVKLAETTAPGREVLACAVAAFVIEETTDPRPEVWLSVAVAPSASVAMVAAPDVAMADVGSSVVFTAD